MHRWLYVVLYKLDHTIYALWILHLLAGPSACFHKGGADCCVVRFCCCCCYYHYYFPHLALSLSLAFFVGVSYIHCFSIVAGRVHGCHNCSNYHVKKKKPLCPTKSSSILENKHPSIWTNISNNVTALKERNVWPGIELFAA